MDIKRYLLDANIIIKLWKECPQVIDEIKNTENVDFKISKHIAGELSTKEFKEFNGFPVLTDKFLGLLDHIIEIDSSTIEQSFNCNIDINHDFKKGVYYIDGNKISKNDYELICACKINNEYILVTEDKKIQRSAKLILGSNKVLSFDEFIEEVRSFNISIE